MAQEQADLGIAARVDSRRKALLVGPQVFDPEFAKPSVQRVPAAMGAAVRRGQVRMPPCLLRNPAWRYAELCRRGCLHEGQVLFVVRGVVHRLRTNHAAVSEEVSEEPQPVFRPAKAGPDWLRDLAWYGYPIAGA